jgi:hypothetical protein
MKTILIYIQAVNVHQITFCSYCDFSKKQKLSQKYVFNKRLVKYCKSIIDANDGLEVSFFLILLIKSSR